MTVITVKRWLLQQHELTMDDYLWINKLKCTIDVKNHTTEVPFSGGTRQMQWYREILIQTTTKQQENMLQLKYGNKIILMSMVMGLPGTTCIDNYGTIYFDTH